MKKLLLKELRLALQPVNLIFLCLSAMLLIPNYPYYVTFFYTSLGLFFMCQAGRENHDIDFTMMLPIRRRDLVRARLISAVAVELAQVTAAVPFAMVNQLLYPQGNLAGMDANAAFFGLALIMLGLFNLAFFPIYYAHPLKVGRAFAAGCAAEAVYILLAEAAAHVIPFFSRRLDTPDPAFMPEKLITLAVGAALFAALTCLACRLSARRFERLDL